MNYGTPFKKYLPPHTSHTITNPLHYPIPLPILPIPH
nr:MAG TPA: hypothetical protein [Caudoviricetes sp.]